MLRLCASPAEIPDLELSSLEGGTTAFRKDMKRKSLATATVETDPRTQRVRDTSDILGAIRQRFQSSGESVEVDFRSLVPWVRVGDQLTHQLHPYPAKLLPHIAHFFLNAQSLQRKNNVVLDPFCGSGTVALEASIAGYSALIADANPLALLISRVKTTPYDPDILRECVRSLVGRARRLKTAPIIDVVNANLWYTPDKKKTLEIVLRAVRELECPVVRDFFLVCFSVVVRKLSFADPAISVPVRLRAKKDISDHHGARIEARIHWLISADVISEFQKICLTNIDRVVAANQANPDRREATMVGRDARALNHSLNMDGGKKLRAGSVPLILTSPPYGSAQKYVRASSLSLNWLELANPSELSALEQRSIGREHAPKYNYRDLPDTLPRAYRELCQRVGKKNKTRERITLEYLHDMQLAITEMARVTSKGGTVVLVIGNNHVCEEPLRNDEFASEVFQSAGLKLQLAMIDTIKSRGLMTKRNKTASLISRESVLVFSK
jgi:DNA modification methylase